MHGGRATWVFIAFQHNEHQIGEAKELSIKMGFQNFMFRRNNRSILTDGVKRKPTAPPVKKIQQKMFDKFEQSNETPSYVPQTSKLKKWTESGFKDTGCGIQCKV